jgi:hypothetical protein
MLTATAVPPFVLARWRAIDERLDAVISGLRSVLPEPRRVCAWCHADLGAAHGCAMTSHGICPACAERLLEEV